MSISSFMIERNFSWLNLLIMKFYIMVFCINKIQTRRESMVSSERQLYLTWFLFYFTFFSFFLSFFLSLIHKICFFATKLFFIFLYLLIFPFLFSISFDILQVRVFDDEDVPERSLECHGLLNEVEGHERFSKRYSTW